MTNITTGRRIVVSLSCTENQLRKAIARMAQAFEVMGNPAPAGRDHPPISAAPWPGIFGTDFEMIDEFSPEDANGIRHAMARVMEPNGTLIAPSTNPPTTITLCAPQWAIDVFEAMHGSSVGVGSKGFAVRRNVFGEGCWWPQMIGPGSSGGGAENDWTFDDPSGPLEDDGPGEDDGTGSPNNPEHDPPHSGRYICFVEDTVNHWVNFGDGVAALSTNFSFSCWFKGSRLDGPITIVHKRTGSVGAGSWSLTATGNTFSFAATFSTGSDPDGPGGFVSAPADSWQSDEWHHIAVSVQREGDDAVLGIAIDGGDFTEGEPFDITDVPFQEPDGLFVANTLSDPPVIDTDVGENTYCLDNIKFWDDRALSADEVGVLYNGGIIT